jgi:hypothetical protein
MAKTPPQQHIRFLALATATLASAVLVWLLFPHQQHLSSVWVLFAKLVPFLLAIETIAALDIELVKRRNLGSVALPLIFLVFLCYFAPKIFFLSTWGTFSDLYYLVITLLPYTVVALVLCYRLGGANPVQCRRLAYGMLLLMLSGLEDLAFLTINHQTDPRFTSIPQHWTWASHINVFFGHPATKDEAFTFIAIHVVLALLVLFLPGRVVRKLAGFRPERSGKRHLAFTGDSMSKVNAP